MIVEMSTDTGGRRVLRMKRDKEAGVISLSGLCYPIWSSDPWISTTFWLVAHILGVTSVVERSASIA